MMFIKLNTASTSILNKALNQFADHFSNQPHKREKSETKLKGATGVEPVTSRSAVECSTTELCPLAYNKVMKFLFLASER